MNNPGKGYQNYNTHTWKGFVNHEDEGDQTWKAVLPFGWILDWANSFVCKS